ncbi:response regulator [Spirosoma endophyticum]|uniref:Response regulator receiver domain-containing protein n=1 Tax=Spirosoma endophyticum TaxID=662367 RepID=A0A1I2EWZ4_9BACT|nr:response regulator [Spirosoma endophyticum]SFE97385.1 Response regulator receiver domain-containing protein [Spirosoma endophyticum]
MQANALMACNFQQAKLLIIENQEFSWIVTRLALETSLPEIQLDRVSTSQQAMTYLDNCLAQEVALPKLILVELYLPRRADGLSLVRALRDWLAQSLCPQLPILAMSSSPTPFDVQESYRSGASVYVVKGIDMDQQIAVYKAIRQFWWQTSVLPLTAEQVVSLEGDG